MNVGRQFTSTRTFTQDDFNRFAALSGDDNPIHVDPEFSARTKFGRTVAHGMLLYGAICGAVSQHLPGVVQLAQDLRFPSPTYTDEAITIQLTVKDVNDVEGTARIEATITRPAGQVTCEGLDGDSLWCWIPVCAGLTGSFMPLVLIERAESIATLTLNRPERHNSLVSELLRELLNALNEVTEARVLILQANGRSFSTGGDVRAFYEHRDAIKSYASEVVGLLNQTIEALLRFPAPTIAAVNGVVTGGSIGLVLAADLVLVTPNASFTPYYNVVGFSPDGGWTALLPRVIGTARTAEALLTNATISAQQAVEWGLANRVVEADRLRAEAQAAAEVIVPMKINSVRRSIQLLRDHKRSALPKLANELQQFVEQITTAEALDGMREFLKES